MGGVSFEPYALQVRDGGLRELQVGTFEVPENRSSPSGEAIRLRFVRIAARTPSGSPPAVFLAGGPGDSGIQWAQHPPFLRVFERVAESVDVLLLDQRGCGRSERRLEMEPPDTLEERSLADEQGLYALVEAQVLKERRRREAEGACLRAYNPWDSALDLRDLADALGVDQVQLWGYSYGTHLLQAALKAMPERVARAVLCGFEGPDQTLKYPSNVQAQLSRLDRLARAQGVGGELLGTMARVHDRLEGGPVQIECEIARLGRRRLLVGSAALRHIAATWSGVSNRFVRLPKLYRSLEWGETADLAEAVAGWSKTWTKPLTFYLKDGASGATQERLDKIRAEAGRCALGNAINFPFPEIAAAAGASDLGDGFREPLTSNVPMLIFTGSLDGFTPTSNALEGLPGLPRAIHQEIHNAAHNDLLSCAQANEQIAEFLGRGVQPEPRSDLAIEEPRLLD